MLKELGFFIKKAPIVIVLLSLYLINPFGIGFLFGYLLFPVLLLNISFIKKSVDFNFFLFFLFSSIYAVFYAFNPVGGSQFIAIYMLFPPLFYLIGKYLDSNSKSISLKFYILVLIGFLLSFTPLISVFSNILEKGFGQIDRSLPLFWNGQTLSATVMGSFFTLNMCIPALLSVNQLKINKAFKIFMLVSFFSSLMCILRIGTRTQIVISLFTLLMSLIYIIPRQSFKKNLLLFSIFFIGIFFIIKNVSFDLSSDWLSAFASRMENNSGEDIASGGGRTDRWIKSLEHLFTHPLGWDVKEFGYSHNLWFDVLRVSGVIPFVLLVIITIRSLLMVLKASTVIKNAYTLNNLIRIYAFAFILIFMVEPIMDGMFKVFVTFCLFIGVINNHYKTHYGQNSIH